ncbi:integumentary mucin A.1-like [Chironomus tepperi]|uniref:integumentary mucin A.1-like n=1 Tax=Chironomus tepperi TaxID=113505 RepID=UPI00391F996C
MEQLFISLFLIFFVVTGPSSCQSVDDVCRFRITGTFPHPNPQRCDLYVQCFLFQSTERECPTDTIFPPNGGSQCVPGDRDTCTVFPPQTTTSPPLSSTTMNPDICETIGTGIVEIPGDCTRYLLCILGEGSIINCDIDEVFYPTTGRCVPGNPLTCEVFTTTTTTSTTTTPPPTTITTTSTSIQTTSSTFPTTVSSSTISTTTPSSPPIGNVCSGNNFRFVANPDVCWRYFFCLYGIPQPRECIRGFIFIEFLQTCVPGNRSTCRPFIMRLSENVQLLNFSNRF